MSVSKKVWALGIVALLSALMCLVAVGCGSSSSESAGSESSAASTESSAATSEAAAPAAATGEDAQIAIAYQTGLSYAPALIAKEQGLIEKYYKEATGADVTIEWTQMSSGSDINTAITSGSLDVGMLGIGPAVTGITSGLDYKICANMAGQEYGLMTNSADINALGDIVDSQNQISVVNIGSIGHIILAKALVDNGFDAHALDSNLVVLGNPEGMNAVQSGNVACNLTYSSFLFAERSDSTLHELTEVSAAWPKENTNVVAVAGSALYENQALYQAVCDGFAEGQTFINENPEEAAEILCVYDGNAVEDELNYLQQGTYNAETKGVFEMATFMAENGFIDNAPASYNDLVFDNVKGD